MCLSIGTPNTSNSPFVTNEKLMVYGVPELQLCISIGTSRTINFPFGTNGKLMVYNVPTLKLIREFLLIKAAYAPY